MRYAELINAGLTKNETLVYTSLLKMGEVIASKIAEETNINRSLIYRILNDLIKKGLVSYVIKEKRKYFSASSPNRIITNLKEKEQEIRRIIPELLSIRKQTEQIPKIEVYAGKEGMKTLLEEALLAREILVLGAKSDFAEKLIYYYPNWHRRRIKAGIKLKALFEKGHAIGRELKKMDHTTVKYLSEEIKSEIMISIFEENTAIELWLNYPTTILIKDKSISQGFKEYFDLLWKISKK